MNKIKNDDIFPRAKKEYVKKSQLTGYEAECATTKADLYRELKDTYHLPDIHAKGVTKEYLKRVKNKQVFTVERVEIQSYLIKESVQSRILRYQFRTEVEYERLNALLRSRNKFELGFDTTKGYPNEKWLMEVIRYSDPLNF